MNSENLVRKGKQKRELKFFCLFFRKMEDRSAGMVNKAASLSYLSSFSRCLILGPIRYLELATAIRVERREGEKEER